jgi:polyhydroxybutyrate depolymerase
MEVLCNSGVPVPILLIHGTADTNVLWEGSTTVVGGREMYVTFPMDMTVGMWVSNNLCTEDASYEDLPLSGKSPNTMVRVISWGGCADDKGVVVYAVIGGGHNWPGRPGFIDERVAGDVNQDFQPAEVIWEFFSQYALAED